MAKPSHLQIIEKWHEYNEIRLEFDDISTKIVDELLKRDDCTDNRDYYRCIHLILTICDDCEQAEIG